LADYQPLETVAGGRLRNGCAFFVFRKLWRKILIHTCN